MKKIPILTLLVLSFKLSIAQIAKTTIVEHFTNTNCSICANQNPGIHTILDSHPAVIHISFHPSAPYPSCVFSMANTLENDARTNYYNIYGGTPRLIVNGVLTTTPNLNATLTALDTSTTNFSLTSTQQFITPDSVIVKVVVKKVGVDTFSQAILFAGVKQDTIYQTTGNGESVHYDVFRKALSATTGDMINLPLNLNDSSTLYFYYKVLPTWVSTKLQTICILQDVNKQVINASESINMQTIPTFNTETQNDIVKVYPNPSSDFFSIMATEAFTHYEIRTMQGRVVAKGLVVNAKIPVAHMAEGNYMLALQSNKNTMIKKIQIIK